MRRSLLLFAVLAGLTVSPLWGKTLSRELQHQFDVREGMTLHVRHGDGDVKIVPWDQDRVEVSIEFEQEYSRFGIGEDPTFDVEFRQGAKLIEVLCRLVEPGPLSWYSEAGEGIFLVEIRAPSYLALDLDGDDGEVRIDGWRNDLDITLEQGDLILSDVEGSAHVLKFGSGDLTIDGLRGVLAIHGRNGDMELTGLETERCRIEVDRGNVRVQAARGDFKVRSESGDVIFEGLIPGVVDIETVKGDVDLVLEPSPLHDLLLVTFDGHIFITLPAEPRGEIALDTRRGRIRLDLPEQAVVEQKRTRASGRLGAGEGRIEMRSHFGDLELKTEVP